MGNYLSFGRETVHDQYWYENFNYGVLQVAGEMEKAAFEWMRGNGMNMSSRCNE